MLVPLYCYLEKVSSSLYLNTEYIYHVNFHMLQETLHLLPIYARCTCIALCHSKNVNLPCIYIHIYVSVCIYIYIYIYVCVCLYIYMCVCVCVRVCVCVIVCMCVYVCMYVCSSSINIEGYMKDKITSPPIYFFIYWRNTGNKFMYLRGTQSMTFD